MADEKYIDADGLEHILRKQKPTAVPIPSDPSQLTFKYTGQIIKPAFPDIDSTLVIVDCPNSINVGTYTARIKLKNTFKTCWSDGTTYDKDITYYITKVDGTMTVDKNSATLTASAPSTTVTTSNTKGSITASSSDTSVATTSLNGNNIVITAKKTGKVTVTITDAGNANYNSISRTVDVRCLYVTNVSFANASDSELLEIINAADDGVIDLYADAGWRVGDERVVTLTEVSGIFSNYKINSGNITLVLLDRGSNQTFTLVNSVKNKNGSTRTVPSFLVGTKTALSSGTSPNHNPVVLWGGNTSQYTPYSFSDTDGNDNTSRYIKGFVNNNFKSALPSTLLPCFKQFIQKCLQASSGNGKPGTMINDTTLFSIPSAVEIYSSSTNGYSKHVESTEINALKQFEYYKTSANQWFTTRVGDALLNQSVATRSMENGLAACSAVGAQTINGQLMISKNAFSNNNTLLVVPFGVI